MIRTLKLHRSSVKTIMNASCSPLWLQRRRSVRTFNLIREDGNEGFELLLLFFARWHTHQGQVRVYDYLVQCMALPDMLGGLNFSSTATSCQPSSLLRKIMRTPRSAKMVLSLLTILVAVLAAKAYTRPPNIVMIITVSSLLAALLTILESIRWMFLNCRMIKI